MKCILHFTETSEPGGSETILAYITKNLAPDRFRAIACLIEKGWLTGHLDELGVKYVIIENKRSYDPIFLANLVKLIRKEKINLVHSHEFFTNFYGSVAARITGIPMIGTIHGKGYFTEKKSRIIAYKAAIKLCTRMIAVSEDLRSYLIRELNLRKSNKIMTIYNGIDLKKYRTLTPDRELRRKLSIPEEAVIAGTVGSLFKVKGIEYLLEAVKEVIGEFPKFRLVIAGEGHEGENLKRLAFSLGIQDYVLFLGFRDDIPQLLNMFDFYVCSSISEGMSLSILEAMAVARPVVATDVGGNPELVTQGDNGFLLPARDPHALAEMMKTLIRANDLRVKMGIKGKEKAQRYFSLETMIENYQNLYDELIVR